MFSNCNFSSIQEAVERLENPHNSQTFQYVMSFLLEYMKKIGMIK